MPETAQPFLPFAKINLSEAAIEEVVSTLRSGWITTGAKVQKFEEMLSEYHTPTLALPLTGGGLGGGGRRALCVSSATAGLHIALLALGLQEGDEGNNHAIYLCGDAKYDCHGRRNSCAGGY